MFSGYLDVEKGVKELYYLFVESLDRFNTDPIMIYLAGGPGCTSMLGAFVLHGPCVVDDDSYFFDNPYSWNWKLNVLYIDAPAGVGYSFAKDANAKKQNDYISSDDNLKAVLSFF